MKKILITLTMFIVLIACNSGEEKKEGDKKGETATADVTKHPDYQKGFDLVAKSDCFTCHKVDGELTGPSYKLVAQKYQGASEEKIGALAQTIIKGGKGNWGESSMTAHGSISEEDAKAMVRYVLLLK